MMKWIRYGIALAYLLQSAACSSAQATPTLAASQELTYHENLAFVPPPPENVKAEPEGGAVVLSWKPSRPVTIKHQYDDTPISYNIFRRQEGEFEFTLLGGTDEAEYKDDSVKPGVTYSYTISGIYRNVDGSEINGSRSSEVSITIPGTYNILPSRQV